MIFIFLRQSDSAHRGFGVFFLLGPLRGLVGKDGRMRRGEVLGDVLSLEWPLGDARTVGTRLGDEAPFSLLPSFPRLEWMSRRSSPRLPGDEGFRGSWMLGFCTEVLCGSGDVA